MTYFFGRDEANFNYLPWSPWKPMLFRVIAVIAQKVVELYFEFNDSNIDRKISQTISTRDSVIIRADDQISIFAATCQCFIRRTRTEE